MKYGPQRHHRRSIRLQGYDYAQAGAYFVTVCAYNRECLFGEIMGEEMQVNASGEIVIACWHDIPRHFANVELDAFVVMPNHVHGIIMLRDVNDPDIGVGAGFKPAPTLTASRHGLPEIVRAFKTFRHAVSMNCAKCPVYPCGSAITMSTSSATRNHCTTSAGTFKKIRCAGHTIGKTQPIPL